MINWHGFDKWTKFWILGSTLSTIILYTILPLWKIVILILGGAILKELGDIHYHLHNPNEEHWFWDRRGASIDDIFCAVLGIGLGLLIYFIIIITIFVNLFNI